MMEQKIEAASRVPNLLDASNEFHTIESDLGDVNALAFAIANSNSDFNIDPRAVRGLWLAINAVRERAASQRALFEKASTLTPIV